MTKKQIALQYLNQGLSVIPLISPAMASQKLSREAFIKKCKTPLVDWKEFQMRRSTEEEISSWFDKWPDASIGIVTGKISNLGRFDKGIDMVLRQAANKIRQGQSDTIITEIYQRHKDNPLIHWKKEIKKVVGIPVSKINGLDI